VSGAGLSSLGLPAPQEIVAQALPAAGANPGRTAEAAKQFEGMLMENLFRLMRKTVEPSGLFGKDGNTQSTYEYLLDQAVTTNAMNAGKGLGLSQKLVAAWSAKELK